MVPILIIGVGNTFRGDDAAGLAVARQLKKSNLPQIKVAESDGEVTQLMGLWEEAEQVWAVDALASSGRPGFIRRFEVQDKPLPADGFHYSSHSFSLPEAIELSRSLGSLPKRFVVYGIEGENFSASEGLSPNVEEAVPFVAKKILAEIQDQTEG